MPTMTRSNSRETWPALRTGRWGRNLGGEPILKASILLMMVAAIYACSALPQKPSLDQMPATVKTASDHQVIAKEYAADAQAQYEKHQAGVSMYQKGTERLRCARLAQGLPAGSARRRDARSVPAQGGRRDGLRSRRVGRADAGRLGKRSVDGALLTMIAAPLNSRLGGEARGSGANVSGNSLD